MVKQVEREGVEEYVCEACGYRYYKREIAERCEAWCFKNHSCNLEIIEQGMPPEEL